MTKDDLEEKAVLEETAGDQSSEDDETGAEEASLTETDEEIRALEEKLAEVETKLAEAEKITAEYLDGWQRAQAAFANFRKRTEAEQSEWTSRANARLLSRILPVLDDFKRAFETVPEKYQEDDWIKGLHLVERKLKSVLDSENVKAMELSPGDAFDPNLHEAVLYQEVPGFEEGDIVAEIETGYTIGDRILRPALVVVAKGSAAPASAETSVEAEEAEGAAQMPESEVSAEATTSQNEDVEETKEPMSERESDLGDRA
ncbi:MAG: nucleotide exchange factor GrpE [Anaerolineae bacterium]